MRNVGTVVAVRPVHRTATVCRHLEHDGMCVKECPKGFGPDDSNVCRDRQELPVVRWLKKIGVCSMLLVHDSQLGCVVWWWCMVAKWGGVACWWLHNSQRTRSGVCRMLVVHDSQRTRSGCVSHAGAFHHNPTTTKTRQIHNEPRAPFRSFSVSASEPVFLPLPRLFLCVSLPFTHQKEQRTGGTRLHVLEV